MVAVYHSRDDKPEIVNLKKSVAASFQSNFKQTEDEEEDDPQSKHVSHYRYTGSSPDNVVKTIVSGKFNHSCMGGTRRMVICIGEGGTGRML